jgi:hypothetical protein
VPGELAERAENRGKARLAVRGCQPSAPRSLGGGLVGQAESRAVPGHRRGRAAGIGLDLNDAAGGGPVAVRERGLQRFRAVLLDPGVMARVDEARCAAAEPRVGNAAGQEVVGELPELECVVVAAEVFPLGQARLGRAESWIFRTGGCAACS